MKRRPTSLVQLLLLAACTSQADDPPPSADHDPHGEHAPAIPWIEAAPPLDLSLVEAPARVLLAPGSSAEVTPTYPARVILLHVQPGQDVALGDPIVDVIMPTLIQAAGDHQAATTRLRSYRGRRDQLEALRREGLSRLAERSEVDIAIAEAEAQEARAHATLQSAGVAPAGARAILRSGGKLTLRAPIAGTVTEVAGALGGNYDPTSGPLARILAPSPARIEARFTRLPPVNARFELRLGEAAPIPLRVIREAPTIDGRDAALPIWFEPEQGQSLRPGTIGQVVALLGDTDGVVSLPPRAVTLDGGRAFVVSQGRGPIAVHVLASAPEGILLRAAEPPQLRPGEAFAADAAALLRPGQGDEH